MSKSACGLAGPLLILSSCLLEAQAPGPGCDPSFRRADSNGDGEVDISDGIKTLLFLFTGGDSLSCPDAADANDSGDLDLSDGIFTFAYLFAGAADPPAPGPLLCGTDPTLDRLECLDAPACPLDPACACEEGQVRPCGTSSVGECSLGSQTCVNGRWQRCTGNREPADELCDGLDNDCDGVTDEPFQLLGSACDGDDEDLCVTGTFVCRADGTGLECSGETPSVEVCDGSDNDCDGEVDEGFDSDADGWTTCRGDCDDSKPGVNPGVSLDHPDGIDNDCDGETDEGPFTTSHARDIQPIWSANCASSGCHDASFPQANLSLSPGSAYSQLVNRRSGDVRTMDRVEPLDPERSYLWHKLNGTQASVGGFGTSMPRGGALLPLSTRDLIKTWILEGAPP